MKFFELILYTTLAISASGLTLPSTCGQNKIRKEWRELTTDEKTNYVNAVKALKALPSTMNQGNKYEDFAYIHDLHKNTIHSVASFLPWHRLFLKDFENELQKIDPSVNLPYWQWSVDSQAPENSPILGPGPLQFGTGFGTGGACVTDGFAANWKKNDNSCLLRGTGDGAGQDGKLGAFYSGEHIASIVKLSTFDNFWNTLEGSPHALPHLAIGGDMAGMASPHDPIFYLHHTYIDKIWADWQKLGNGRYSEYSKIENKNKKLSYYQNTVSSVLDHRNLCYEYSYGVLPDGTPPTSKVTPPATTTTTTTTTETTSTEVSTTTAITTTTEATSSTATTGATTTQTTTSEQTTTGSITTSTVGTESTSSTTSSVSTASSSISSESSQSSETPQSSATTEVTTSSQSTEATTSVIIKTTTIIIPDSTSIVTISQTSSTTLPTETNSGSVTTTNTETVQTTYVVIPGTTYVTYYTETIPVSSTVSASSVTTSSTPVPTGTYGSYKVDPEDRTNPYYIRVPAPLPLYWIEMNKLNVDYVRTCEAVLADVAYNTNAQVDSDNYYPHSCLEAVKKEVYIPAQTYSEVNVDFSYPVDLSSTPLNVDQPTSPLYVAYKDENKSTDGQSSALRTFAYSGFIATIFFLIM
ncbi:hypothetical protein HDU92_006985 [Lobulomyces angularis]|nr:hypothetical protein HDU92_006985 [Lobulomyces angularis]